MDALNKIKVLMSQRNWSQKRLAKEAALSQSTISSLFRKGNAPTIPTLESICRAFGLSLSEFFAEGNNSNELTPEQLQMFEKWSELEDEQKKILMQLIDNIKR